MSEKKNYIILNRSIKEHWLWEDKPFSKGQAWIDLLLRARWKDGKELYRGELVDRKRGTVYCSMAFLAQEWGWHRQTVKRFLNILEADGMVKLSVTKRDTAIIIENYNKHQLSGSDECTSECTSDYTSECTSGASQKKKDKKDKKEKNIYLGVSDETKADAEAILSYLNEKSGKHFKDGKGNMENILARLKEGYKVSDLKRVIDLKVNEWKDDQRMNQWINPVTLFRPKNFERYLNTMNTEQDNEEAELFATILRKMRNGMGYHRLYNKEQKVITLDGFMRAQKYLDTAADEDLIEMLKGA